MRNHNGFIATTGNCLSCLRTAHLNTRDYRGNKLTFKLSESDVTMYEFVRFVGLLMLAVYRTFFCKPTSP